MSAKSKPVPAKRHQTDLDVIEETVRQDAEEAPKQYAEDGEVPEGGE